MKYPKPPHFRYFVFRFVSSSQLVETSNLVDGLIVASTSPLMANYTWRGVVRSREPFKFWWAPTISPERHKLEWLNFVCMYVNAHHKDNKSLLKGAWSGSHDPILILMPQWYLWNN